MHWGSKLSVQGDPEGCTYRKTTGATARAATELATRIVRAFLCVLPGAKTRTAINRHH